MIRMLLLTTAIGFVLTGGAYAASTTTAATVAVSATGYTMLQTDALASKVIGSKVYSSTAGDAPEIGTVKDLILNADGHVPAAVLAVGGFLGVGEKAVAVPFSDLQWTVAGDGGIRTTYNTTKEALTALPDFKYPADNASRPAASTDQSAAARADVDTSQLKPIDLASLKAEDLKGIDVVSPTGQKLGEIDDFVLRTDGKVDAVIVDFGGFLGIGKKYVAIAYDALKFLADAKGTRYLMVSVTKEQLDAQRPYDKNDYAANRTSELLVVKP